MADFIKHFPFEFFNFSDIIYTNIYLELAEMTFPLNRDASGSICSSLSRRLSYGNLYAGPESLEMTAQIIQLSKLTGLSPGSKAEIRNYLRIFNCLGLSPVDQQTHDLAAAILEGMACDRTRAHRLASPSNEFRVCNLNDSLSQSGEDRPRLRDLIESLTALFIASPLRTSSKEQWAQFFSQHYSDSDLRLNAEVCNRFDYLNLAVQVKNHAKVDSMKLRLALAPKWSKAIQDQRSLLKNSHESVQTLERALIANLSPSDQLKALSSCLIFFQRRRAFSEILQLIRKHAISSKKHLQKDMNNHDIVGQMMLFGVDASIVHLRDSFSKNSERRREIIGNLSNQVDSRAQILEQFQELEKTERDLLQAQRDVETAVFSKERNAGDGESPLFKPFLMQIGMLGAGFQYWINLDFISHLHKWSSDPLQIEQVSNEARSFIEQLNPPELIQLYPQLAYIRKGRVKVKHLVFGATNRLTNFLQISDEFCRHCQTKLQERFDSLKEQVDPRYVTEEMAVKEKNAEFDAFLRRLIAPNLPSKSLQQAWNSYDEPSAVQGKPGTQPLSAMDWEMNTPLSSKQRIQYHRSPLRYDLGVLSQWQALSQNVALSSQTPVQCGFSPLSEDQSFGLLPLADLFCYRGAHIVHQPSPGRKMDIHVLKCSLTQTDRPMHGYMVWGLDSGGICFYRKLIRGKDLSSESDSFLEEIVQEISDCDLKRKNRDRSQSGQWIWPVKIDAKATIDEQMGIAQMRVARELSSGVLQLYLNDPWDRELLAPEVDDHWDHDGNLRIPPFP